MNPMNSPQMSNPMNANTDPKAQGNTCSGVRADKGLGHYPISDLQFDVITLVFEKSKALQAYDQYLTDSQANPELREIFEQIAMDDRKHIEKLRTYLGNC